MKKTNTFIVILLTLFSTFSQAEQALTRELITSFQQMSEQWEALEVNYPELSASLDEIDLSQPDKIISQLKSSDVYPKIKSILAKYDFDSIEEYYDVAKRVMGGIANHQMQKMPEGMNIDAMAQMLQQNIQQMKSTGASEAMISEMKKQLADMEKNMIYMKEMMKNTSAADNKFISDNAEWIMSLLGDN